MSIFTRMLDVMRKKLRLEIFADKHGVFIWAYDDDNNKLTDPWDLENSEFDRSGNTIGEAIFEAFKRFQEWEKENGND